MASRLDFANCTNLDVPSLKALADDIPRSVEEVVLVFLGTGVNCNVKSVKELRHIKQNAGALERIKRMVSCSPALHIETWLARE